MSIGLIASPSKASREARALADVLRAVVGEADDERLALSKVA